MTLAYAGNWLSQALIADQVDLSAGAPVFETLKKRPSSIYRPVPVPLSCAQPSTWFTVSANSSPVATMASMCGSGAGRR
jgi:hypothetical protein